MNLYFARHGESEANTLNIISNRDSQHPLTEKGVAQALNLAEQLKDAKLAGIFCSPILRAMQTAQVVGEALKIPVAKADALREFDCGVVEGKSDMESWMAIGHAVRNWIEVGDLDYRIDGGESCREVMDRFNGFVQKLIGIGSSDSFLLVSHGGTLRLTLPLLFHDLPKELYQDQFFEYGNYARAEVMNGQFLCREWCGKVLD